MYAGAKRMQLVFILKNVVAIQEIQEICKYLQLNL